MSLSQSQTGISGHEPQVKGVLSRRRLPRRNKLYHLFNNSLFTALVIIIGLLWSIPTFGLFVSSFRPGALIKTTGWWTGLVPPWNFTIENYEQVLSAQGLGQAFLNSLIIAIPGTLLPLAIGAFAAYAFAWMKFPGRDFIFLGIVALLVIPSQTAFVPVLQLFTAIGITGQYLAVWI